MYYARERGVPSLKAKPRHLPHHKPVKLVPSRGGGRVGHRLLYVIYPTCMYVNRIVGYIRIHKLNGAVCFLFNLSITVQRSQITNLQLTSFKVLFYFDNIP